MTESRVKSRRMSMSALLGATALSGLLGLATAPAHAQDTAAQAANNDDTTVVVITGYRGSLQNSAQSKKRAVGFQDSIYAEDIGKFPDGNIAESLNRIPGVIITREINGDGTNIAIRGLGTNFTKVLLNGASVAVASTGSTDSQNVNREVDLDLFPTELFTSLTVDKTASASMLEGGAAGTVNMRQARPFDNKGNHLTYSVGMDKNSNASDWGTKASVLASGTWGNIGLIGGIAINNSKVANNGFETIGWTNANLSATQDTSPTRNNTGGGNWTIPGTVPANAGNGLHTGDTIDQAFLLANNPGATIEQIDNGLIPRLGRPMNEYGTRDRTSAIFGVEWRPSDDFKFHLDTMYAHKQNKMQRTDMDWVGRNGAMIPLNLKFDRTDCSDGCVVTSGTFANAQAFLEYRPYTETTDFKGVNPGFEWKLSDTFTWNLDANWTKSTFHRESPTVLVITAPNSGMTLTYTNDGSIPVMKSSVDLNNPANFVWNGGRLNIQDERRETETKGVHTNIKWGDSSFNLTAGLAYDDTSRRITAYDNSQAWQNAACGDNPSVYVPGPNSQPACKGDNLTTADALLAGYPAYPGYGTGYTTGQTGPVTYSGSLVPQSALASYLTAGPYGYIALDWNKFAQASKYQQFHDAAPLVGSSNTSANTGFVEEKVSGVYVQLNGDRDIFDGHRLRWNLGARSLDTEQTIGGLVSVPDPRNTPASGPAPADGGKYPNRVNWVYTKTHYHNFLPALNAAFNLTDNLIVRYANSTTMTRPNPNTMLPGLNFSSPSADTGSVGNPALKPYISKNWDLGVEWYTGKEGYVAVTAFDKKLSGFTTNGNTTVPFSALAAYGVTYDTLSPTQQTAINARGGPGSASVTLSEQVNIASKLIVDGTEFTWVQPLGQWWSPLEGFGFSTNYTEIRHKAAAGVAFLGVPDTTYNFTGYYENHGVSIHVSDNYNNKSQIGSFGQNGITNAGLYADARSQWDLSSSFDLGKLFGLSGWAGGTQIVVNATNLTDEPIRTYFQYDNAAFTDYKPGKTIYVGLRGKF